MKKKVILLLSAFLLTAAMTVQNTDAAAVSENGFTPQEAGQEETEGADEAKGADQALSPYVECLDGALYNTFDPVMGEESASRIK